MGVCAFATEIWSVPRRVPSCCQVMSSWWPADACFDSTCTPAGAGQNVSQGGRAKQSNSAVQKKAAGATMGQRLQQPRPKPAMSSASPDDNIPAYPAPAAGGDGSERGGLRPSGYASTTASRVSSQTRSAFGSGTPGVGADRPAHSKAGITPHMAENPVNAAGRVGGTLYQSRQLMPRGQLPAPTTVPGATSTIYREASSRSVPGAPDSRSFNHAQVVPPVSVSRK